MKLGALLVAVLPAAALAGTAYTVPASLAAKGKEARSGCPLPTSFHILNFEGQSGEDGAKLASLDFGYRNAITNDTTTCHWDPSITSTTPEGLQPRYPCADKTVKFIWQDAQRTLTMIQRTCADTPGAPRYETSGSVNIPMACDEGGACTSSETDSKGLFTSISPVRDPTLARRGRAGRSRGAAWSYDV